MIIKGREISEKLIANLKEEVSTLPLMTLAIILVGDNPASRLYVNNKIAKAKIIGIHTILIKLSYDVKTEEVIQTIHKLNQDGTVHGILVQLPLPKQLETFKIIESIHPHKDVDGLTSTNVAKLQLLDLDHLSLIPCTAQACIYLIAAYYKNQDHNDQPYNAFEIYTKDCKEILSGKSVVIIGRSNIVGKPLANLLMHYNCTVTICHSYTQNLADFTRKADIVVSAVGKTHFLSKDYFSAKSIVIDVGINRIAKNSGKDSYYKEDFAGDVKFDEVEPLVRGITPVPGGVGPMTVVMLMANIIKAFKLSKKS